MTIILLPAMILALVGSMYNAEYYTALWVFIALTLYVDNVAKGTIMRAQHKVLMDIKERVQYVSKDN